MWMVDGSTQRGAGDGERGDGRGVKAALRVGAGDQRLPAAGALEGHAQGKAWQLVLATSSTHILIAGG